MPKEAFASLVGKSDVIPVVRRIMADHLSPVLAYRRLVAADDRTAPSFLFESVENGDEVAFKVWDASKQKLINMVADRKINWEIGISKISLSNDQIVPETISFSSAYPNPFNPITMISFGVPEEMEVQIVVHDMLGRKVVELANDVYHQGYYELQWNANQESSGIYFVKMVAGGQVNIQKLMLIK